MRTMGEVKRDYAKLDQEYEEIKREYAKLDKEYGKIRRREQRCCRKKSDEGCEVGGGFWVILVLGIIFIVIWG